MQQTGRAEATERVTLDLSREELDDLISYCAELAGPAAASN